MLLQSFKPEMAFLKLGIYGEAGSGKSFTSSLVAVGLAKFIASEKPVGFADTEQGSDFVIPRLFKPAGLEVRVAKTRAFADLLQIVDEAERECDILIIDSVTHFWNELIESYMKKNELKRLALKHWQPLKATWREFTDRFVSSRLHIIVAGRSADKWEEVEDPDDGAKELRKVGTKMRTETEMGYEPSLLVEMEAVQLTPRAGGKLIHRAYVKKDRFDVINGQTFDDPTFDTFFPHISLLNLGGDHRAIELGRDSTAMFDRNDIGERKLLKREIAVEKVRNEIQKLHAGQTEADKKARIALMEEVFKTNSWKEIEALLPIDRLQAGLETLEDKVKAQAEKEAAIAEAAAKKGGNGKPKTKEAHA